MFSTKISLVFVLLVSLQITITPQIGKKNDLRKVTDQKTYTFLDINNISTYFYNDGQSDISPIGNSGFIYPKGTGKTAAFVSGLMWGAKVAGDPDPRVGGSAFRTGLKPGNVNSDGTPAGTASDRFRIYRVRRDVFPEGPFVDLTSDASNEESSTTVLRAEYEKDWIEWPADLGAPFADNNNNGIYEPTIDVPGFPGADQTIWFVANDLDTSQTIFLYGAKPLGIEIQTTAWAYNQPGPIGNMLFRKYKLINKTGIGNLPPITFDSMYVSMWTDIDLGDAGDDFVGTDTTLNLIYTYNANEKDRTYFPLPPPAIGYSFLQGPLVDGKTGEDRNKNGIDDGVDFGILNGQKVGPGKINLPMSASYYFAGGDPNIGDPPQGTVDGSRQFYSYFQGRIGRYSQPFINFVTGLPTTYVLTGDPQKGTGWLDGMQLPPGDRRMGNATGPFTLVPGDSKETVYAEIVAGAISSSDRLAAIGNLKANSIIAKYLYDNNFESFNPPPAPQVKGSELDKKIILDWGENTSAVLTTELNSRGGFTFQGYNVYQLPSPKSTLSEGKRIATFDKIDGVKKILDIYFDPIAGDFLKRFAQYGNDSGIRRSLTITVDSLHYDSYGNGLALINGIKYYYAVTAYNYNPSDVVIPNNFESKIEVITLTPHIPDPGVIYSYAPGDTLKATHTNGISDGISFALVIDPTKIIGHSYEVTFNGDSNWNLVDKTTSMTKLSNQSNLSGDGDYLFVDGMQVKVLGPPLLGKSYQYASASPANLSPVATAADPSYTGGRWFTGGHHGGELFFGGVFMEPNFWGGTTVTSDKYNVVEIRFRPMASFTDLNTNSKYDIGEPYVVDEPTKTQKAFMYTTFAGSAYEGFFDIPFTAWDISTDPANPRQLNVVIRDRDKNKAWDLHNLTTPADPLLPNNGDQQLNYAWILTSTYDPTGTMYGDGTGGTIDFWTGPGGDIIDGQWVMWVNDKGFGGMLAEEATFTLTPNFVNTAADVFTFTATANTNSTAKAIKDIEKINVFPNPFYVANTGDLNSLERAVTFSHLPVKAKIRIFNLAGQMVRALDKENNSQFYKWDLMNDHNLLVASGIYIAFIEMPEIGETKILKFAILQGETVIGNF